MTQIRLLIIDPERDTLIALDQLLAFETGVQIVGTATSLHDALFAAEQKMPDVALVAAGAQGAEGLQISQAIVERMPATRVLLVIPKALASAEFLQRALLSGAKEFIIRPFESGELIESIRRTAAGSNAIAVPAPPVQALTAGNAGGPGSSPALKAVPPPSRHGKVIALYSANGGLGRTTLVVNLAVALQTGGAERVAVMDASLRYGDVGVYLNLRSQRTITEVCAPSGKVDLAQLPDVLATHHTGVKVLLAPASPEYADALTPHAVEQVLDAMRDQFDYVLVDTFSSLDETILTILDHADRILLVATNEMHVVKNMRLFLEVADLLKYPSAKMAVVLNRYNPKSQVTSKEIESAMGQPVFAIVDRDDATAVEAVQAGLPFVIGKPKAPISQAVLRLARQLVPELQPAAAPRKRGLFGAR